MQVPLTVGLLHGVTVGKGVAMEGVVLEVELDLGDFEGLCS